MNVLLGAWLAAQAAYAAVLCGVWAANDGYWKHIPRRGRRALLAIGVGLAPHVGLMAWLGMRLVHRLQRRRRVYAALMDMNRRQAERGAGERCPRCGEYH